MIYKSAAEYFFYKGVEEGNKEVDIEPLLESMFITGNQRSVECYEARQWGFVLGIAVGKNGVEMMIDRVRELSKKVGVTINE